MRDLFKVFNRKEEFKDHSTRVICQRFFKQRYPRGNHTTSQGMGGKKRERETRKKEQKMLAALPARNLAVGY